MTPQPYYDGGDVQLYHGDCRKVLPALGQRFDACLADPPYQQTSLTWDRWPGGWLDAVAGCTDSLWCFGSLRMFMARSGEFEAGGWRLSHDTVGEWEIDTAVWEKRNGTGFARDRMRGVHELAAHWYRGAWRDIHHEVPRVPSVYDAKGRTTSACADDRAAHTGAIASRGYVDDGLRLVRSVIHAPSVRGGISRTQKPVDLFTPLIAYAVPPGGIVLDPTAGSGTTGIAASALGIRSVLIEGDEAQCESIARRLNRTEVVWSNRPIGDQPALDFNGVEAS